MLNVVKVINLNTKETLYFIPDIGVIETIDLCLELPPPIQVEVVLIDTAQHTPYSAKDYFEK